MSKLYISIYHYTRDLKNSRYPDIKGLDSSLFREQILFMKEHFHIVTMEEVMEAAGGHYKLPEDPMLLTFDDGYIDNYTFAFPVLDELGVQGSFFIPGKTFTTYELLDVNKIHYLLASTDIHIILKDLLERMDHYRGNEYSYPSNEELFQEYAKSNRFDGKEVIFVKRMLQTVLPEELRNRIASELFVEHVGISEQQLAHELHMTAEQIRTLKHHGMYIGVHGYDHYWLGNLSKEKMQQDMQKALEIMDEFIDSKKWVMNYPYGSYNEDVIRYAKEHGACVGVTTEVRIADLEIDDVMKLPRLDCNDYPPKSENYKRMGQA